MIKKRLALVLSVLLMVTSLAGCGGKKTVENQGEGVQLRWVLPGAVDAESNAVWEAFNKELSQNLNGTTIDFNVVSFSEYAERWQLMMASKDSVDIAWTGYLLSYLEEIKNGSYLPLDELLDQYGQDLKKEIPDWLLKKQQVGGKTYSIPNMQQETNEGTALFFQKDLADKYMDKEKLEAVLNKDTYVTQEGWDALGEYLEALKQNGELREGVSTRSVPSFLGKLDFEALTGNFGIIISDEKPTVYHLFETPQKKLSFDAMADWYKKGYIRKDIASLDNTSQYEFKENGNILWSHNYFKGTAESYSKLHQFDIDAIGIGNRGYITSAESATGTAIAMTSKHPEEAMKVLNLLNTEAGTDFYNLLVNGIEGTHYTIESENRISRIFNEKGVPKYNTFNRWVVGNTFNGFEYEDQDPVGWNDYLQNDVHANAAYSELLGFKVDISGVRNEMIHVKAIEQEFGDSLSNGTLSDHRATYDEMMAKLEAAGMNVIKENIQKQIDEWLAQNGK